MAETQNIEEDPALIALTALAEATAHGADQLNALSDDLMTMRRRRRRGWQWRRIASNSNSLDPLSDVTKVAATLGVAGGEFRRSLARALRDEGMKVAEIAALFDVARQRVSALIRPREEAKVAARD